MATKDKQREDELESEREDEEEASERDEDERASEPEAEASDSEQAEASGSDEESAEAEPAEARARDEEDDEAEDAQAAQLGATKYVHAAFFSAGMLAAYLVGKILYTIWNYLADWPAAVRAVPALLRYAEDDRETYTMIAGAIIGVAWVLHTYRKEHVRRWADEVATELSKVTWPTKDTVTNGTIVVVVASAIATVYVALLDRLWGFLTNLVYGA